MKYKFILLILFISSLTFAQTNYDRGFQIGYKNGYCYNKGIGCLPPIPPITPIPRIGEDSYSYQDGYNRGFETGLNNEMTNESERQRYKTSSTEPIDYIQKQNINDIVALANVLKEAKGKAFELYEQKNYQASINIAQAGLKILPNDIEFEMLIASCNLELRNYDIALKYFKKIQKKSPNNDIATTITEIENGIYQKRVSEQDKLAIAKTNTERKSEWDEFNNKLKIYNETKDYEGILNLMAPYQAKIKSGKITDEKFIKFILRYTVGCYYENKEWNNIISDATLAIQKITEKEVGFFYFFRGMAKSNLGDYYGSNSDYDFIINNYKEINYSENSIGTLYNNKAYNYILLNEFKLAEPLIIKAIELDKSKDYIWSTKGEYEYKTGKYNEAIKSMTNSININPSSISYLYRGLAKIKTGKKTEGCLDLSKAGELGDNNAYNEIKKYCK